MASFTYVWYENLSTFVTKNVERPTQFSQTLVTLFQTLEATLHDPKKTYQDKVNALLIAWEKLVSIIEKSTVDKLEELTECIYRQTLLIVLQGEWPTITNATKTHLTVTINRIIQFLSWAPEFQSKFYSLLDILRDPWGRPTLDRIIKGSSASISDQELIEFCDYETSSLLIMRLAVLTNAKCVDIALKLARICVRGLRLPGSRLCDYCPVHHHEELIDFYVAILFKEKQFLEIVNEVLTPLTLEEGYDLILRHAELTVINLKLWKSNQKIPLLEACYFIKRAFAQKDEVDSVDLHNIIRLWARLHQRNKTSNESLVIFIKNFAEKAVTTLHIYKLCNTLKNELDSSFKPLFIEMFIQGLTIDLNAYEKNRMEADKDKVKEYEIQLANGFLELAALLEDNIGVSRECLLTAFSLNPTQETFSELEEIALTYAQVPSSSRNVPQSKQTDNGESDGMCESCRNIDANSSGHIDSGQASSSNTPREHRKNSVVECDSTTSHRASTSTSTKSSNECVASTSSSNNVAQSNKGVHQCSKCGNSKSTTSALDAIVSITGDRVTQDLNYDVLSAPNQVLDAEQLGVSEALCDDLAVLLSSPRWHLLSWVLKWSELETLCKKYLNDPEGTRYIIKELKHVEVDYEQFKHLPSVEYGEYYGIEEGYEHLLNEEAPKAKTKRGAAKGRKKTTKTAKSKPPTPTHQRGRRKRVVRKPKPFDASDSNELPVAKKKQDPKPTPKNSKSKTNPKTQLPKKVRRKSAEVPEEEAVSDGPNSVEVPDKAVPDGPTVEVPTKTVSGRRKSVDIHSKAVSLHRKSTKGQTKATSVRRKSAEIQPTPVSDSHDSAEVQAQAMPNSHATAEIQVNSVSEDEGEESSRCSEGGLSDQELDNSKPKVLVNSTSPAARRIYKSIIQKPNIQCKNKSNLSSQFSVYNSGFDPDFEFTYILNQQDSTDDEDLRIYGFPFFVRLPSIPPVAVICPSDKVASTPVLDSTISSNSSLQDSPASQRAVPGLIPLSHMSQASLPGTPQSSPPQSPSLPDSMLGASDDLNRSFTSDAGSTAESTTSDSPTIRRLRQFRPSGSESPKKGAPSLSEIDLHPTIVLDKLDGSVTSNVSSSDIMANYKKQLSSSVKKIRSKNAVNTIKGLEQNIYDGAKQHVNFLSDVPGMTTLDYVQPSGTNSVVQVAHLSDRSETNTNSGSSSNTTAVQVSGANSSVDEPTTSVANVTSTTSVVHPTASATPQSSPQVNAPAKQSQAPLAQLGAGTASTVTPVLASTSAAPRKISNSLQTTVTLPMSVANTLPTVSGRQLADSPAVAKTDYSNKGAQTKNNSNSSKVQNPINAPVQSASTSVTRIVVANTNPPAATAAAAKRPSQGLPKFQQAFGKTIPAYQSGEAASSAVPNTASVPTNSAAVGKPVQTAVVGNLQPQQLTYAALPVFVSSVGSRIMTTLPPGCIRRTTPVNISNQVTAAAAAALGSGLPRHTLTSAAAALTSASSARFTPTLIPGGLAKPRAETSIPQIRKDVMNKMELSTAAQNVKSTSTTTSEDTTNLAKSIMDDSSSDESTDSSSQTLNHLANAGTAARGVIQQFPRHIPTSMTAQATQTPQAANNSTSSLTTPNTTNNLAEQLLEFEAVLKQVTNTSNMKERESHTSEGGDQVIATSTISSTGTVNPTLQFATRVSPTFGGPEVCVSSTATTSIFPPKFPPTNVRVAYVTPAGNLAAAQAAAAARVPPNIPLVVVTNYSQPVASPALSITSQSSSSPSVSSAQGSGPASAGKTGKPSASKPQKPKTAKAITATNTKASPVAKPQQKPQEDEHTVQRIYAILGEYAEQLRNSPDLNNKPAPRRRSNPPTNPTQSKRKKSSPTKMKPQGSEMSPSGDDIPGGSEDSSSGIAQGLSDRASPVPHSGEELDENPNSEPEKPETTESSSSELSAVASSSMASVINTSSAAVLASAANTAIAVATITTTTSSAIQGKSVMVGNSLPCVIPTTVRQVLLGTVSAVQRQQFKGSKLIRVLSTNTPTMITTLPVHGVKPISGTSALVLQPVCNLNKICSSGAQFQNTVRQVKIPMGSISSQALSGVTAQPPVVLPQGTHTITTNTFCGFTPTLSLTEPGSRPDPKASVKPVHLANAASSTTVVTHTSLAEALTAVTSVITSTNKCESHIKKEQLSEAEQRLLPCTSTSSFLGQVKSEMEDKCKTSASDKVNTSQTTILGTSKTYAQGDHRANLPDDKIDCYKMAYRLESQECKLATQDGVSTKPPNATLHITSPLGATSAAEKAPPSATLSAAVIEENREPPSRLCDIQHRIDLHPLSDDPQLHHGDSYVKATDPTSTASVESTPSVLQTSSENQASKVQCNVKSVSQFLVKTTPPITRSSSLSNSHATQTTSAQVAGSSSSSEGTQVSLDHPDKAGEAPTASHSGVKRTYSNIREHSLEYQPFKAKVVKSKVLEPQADVSLEHKLRQEAMEKELRLQKSLSEECEDLGVDEPSTSDLFPEADLLLDPHPNLNFDSSAADASGSQTVDSNDQFNDSDVSIEIDDQASFDSIDYSQEEEEPSDLPYKHTDIIEKIKESRYGSHHISRRYSEVKSPCSPHCKCNKTVSKENFYISSSGDDSMHLNPPTTPIIDPRTKSPDSREKPPNALKPMLRVGVAQTYGKKITKSNHLKSQGQATSSSDNSSAASRPFASVSSSSTQGQDTPMCQPESSGSSKAVSCSTNGTNTSELHNPTKDKSKDVKESAEAKESRIAKKRKSSELSCEKPGPETGKRLSRRTRSFSDDTMNADDEEEEEEGADEDVDTDESDSAHEDTCESQTYDHKSTGDSESNPWSVGSCKSPDVSQSSTTSVADSAQRLALRSSSRGRRVKKNCSCCNGSPERKIPRTNKLFKKGANGKSVIKGHVLKKR